jgi:hypothetical protein
VVYKYGDKKKMPCVCGLIPKLSSIWLYSCRSSSCAKPTKRIPSGKLTGDNTELTVKQWEPATAEEFSNIIIRTDGAKQ